MNLSDYFEFSEADPCPCCGQFALCVVWPSYPEYLSDEEVEELQQSAVPELTCRACGEFF